MYCKVSGFPARDDHGKVVIWIGGTEVKEIFICSTVVPDIIYPAIYIHHISDIETCIIC